MVGKDGFKDLNPSPVSLTYHISQIEDRLGIRVIRFDLAEPMFSPPKEAVNGTIEAIRSKRYRYSPSWGIPELRATVANFLSSTRGIAYNGDEVLITCGAKFANYSFFAGLLRAGESVILLRPYWMSFKAVPRLLGINLIEVPTRKPFHLDPEALKEAMEKHPKAIVINNPNNPTGGLLNRNDLKLLKDLATDFDLLVLSDEVDWAYTYDGHHLLSPAGRDWIPERTIVTDGFSKVFAMTGWRVGFAAGPKELLVQMHRVQEHAVSAPATFCQYGCLKALDGYKKYIPRLLALSNDHRQRTVRALNATGVLYCPTPEGGFYAYPSIAIKQFKDAPSFARMLLEEDGVAVIPGEFFGDPRNRFRLCYLVTKNDLEEGLERISRFLGRHIQVRRRNCKKSE